MQGVDLQAAASYFPKCFKDKDFTRHDVERWIQIRRQARLWHLYKAFPHVAMFGMVEFPEQFNLWVWMKLTKNTTRWGELLDWLVLRHPDLLALHICAAPIEVVVSVLALFAGPDFEDRALGELVFQLLVDMPSAVKQSISEGKRAQFQSAFHGLRYITVSRICPETVWPSKRRHKLVSRHLGDDLAAMVASYYERQCSRRRRSARIAARKSTGIAAKKSRKRKRSLN